MTSTRKPAAWHFCSTPRNVFLSIGAAWSQPDYEHSLKVIDQPDAKVPALVAALKANPGPFSAIDVLPKGRGTLGKYRIRKQVFRTLAQDIEATTPELILTGNDRRIEFQFVASRLAAIGKPAQCIYLEDGVNSYQHIHPSHSAMRARGDSLLEPLFKKLNYGTWYDRQGAVGCCRWIDQRWLTFPELLRDRDGPEVRPLLSTAYTEGDASAHFLALMTALAGSQPDLSGDLLLVPPHSNDVKQQYGSVTAFTDAVTPLLRTADRARVKYHPNETEAFLGGLAEELPRSLPLELMMSAINCSRIVGDTSAALLSAKWLKPDAAVFSVRNTKPNSAPLYTLFAGAGIKVIDGFDSDDLIEP